MAVIRSQSEVDSQASAGGYRRRLRRIKFNLNTCFKQVFLQSRIFQSLASGPLCEISGIAKVSTPMRVRIPAKPPIRVGTLCIELLHRVGSVLARSSGSQRLVGGRFWCIWTRFVAGAPTAPWERNLLCPDSTCHRDLKRCKQNCRQS